VYIREEDVFIIAIAIALTSLLVEMVSLAHVMIVYQTVLVIQVQLVAHDIPKFVIQGLHASLKRLRIRLEMAAQKLPESYETWHLVVMSEMHIDNNLMDVIRL